MLSTVVLLHKKVIDVQVIFAELHILQNDILIESAQGPKEMWRSLNSVLGKERKLGMSSARRGTYHIRTEGRRL